MLTAFRWVYEQEAVSTGVTTFEPMNANYVFQGVYTNKASTVGVSIETGLPNKAVVACAGAMIVTMFCL